MNESAALEAWTLPPGVEVPDAVEEAVDGDGPGLLVPAVESGWIWEVARTLKRNRDALFDIPAREIVGAVGRTGARFLNPEDPLRARALEWLPRTSGLSLQMASAVLDGMARDWTEERLLRLLEVEFSEPEALDGFVPGSEGRVRALGPALCSQIVAGSVPGVGVTALVRALLTKGSTLLKPGWGDVALPVLFARALREEDLRVGGAVAVVYWHGGDEAVEDAALHSADVITVYGDDDTVRSLRNRAPVTARFVAYHHRVGIGVVGREVLGPERGRRAAMEIAGAVGFFDQRGCVSPQILYVEEGGAWSPEAFAAALGEAFDSLEDTLPAGGLDAHEASRVHQIRGAGELMAAAGSGAVYKGKGTSWTVLFQPDAEFPGACVGRVLQVTPVADIMETAERVAPYGAHLQTVGVAGCGARTERLAEALGRAGATRVAGFVDVPFPPPWWHHDGQGPLEALIRWVDLED
ncbi:MAG: acyl-CoA reductase [Gemmatimonadota bacterium]